MTIAREWANQMVFLASILSGFGIAVAVEFISSGDKRRRVTLAIAAFVISAALLLSVTAVGSLMLVRWELWQNASTNTSLLARLHHIRTAISTLLMAGLALFLVGLGIAGWIHSKIIGAVTTITATSMTLITLWLIGALP